MGDPDLSEKNQLPPICSYLTIFPGKVCKYLKGKQSTNYVSIWKDFLEMPFLKKPTNHFCMYVFKCNQQLLYISVNVLKGLGFLQLGLKYGSYEIHTLGNM